MQNHFSLDELLSFTKSVFLKSGLSLEHATTASKVLLSSDLRGIDSHGVARLKGYVRLIEKQRINTKPKLTVVHETPSTANVDADAAVGLVAAPYAMEIAIKKAKQVGTGWVAIQNSNHFGICAHHAMMALEHDMIGFAITNASPLVTPALGKERMLGTNPICFAIPAGNEIPFVLDMATSAASNGKLEIAQRLKKQIPTGWIQKENGEDDTDPHGLSQKGMLKTLGSDMEHGSYKGYGLSALVDILSGVLSGANYGPWVPPFVAFLDPVENQPGKGIGHLVGAMRVDAFRPIEEFKKNMDLWIQRFKTTTPLIESQPVKIPGENEHYATLDRIENGIDLNPEVVADLQELAQQFQLHL